MWISYHNKLGSRRKNKFIFSSIPNTVGSVWGLGIGGLEPNGKVRPNRRKYLRTENAENDGTSWMALSIELIRFIMLILKVCGKTKYQHYFLFTLYQRTVSFRWGSPEGVRTTLAQPTMQAAIENPASLILPSSIAVGYKYDWLYNSMSNLWSYSSEGLKTIYDPCPYGYKVPDSEIQALFSAATYASPEAPAVWRLLCL